MSSYFIDARRIRTQAQGQWLSIIRAVCPGMFEQAINKIGDHVVCPFHGGKNDFRMLSKPSARSQSTAQNGGAICSCGSWADGFELLQDATGKSFYEVLKLVNTYLNGTQTKSASGSYKPALKPASVKEQTPVISEADKERQLEKLRSLWNGAATVSASNYSTYYQGRGISASTLRDVRNLRCLAQLGFYERVQNGEGFIKKGTYPALLGLMRNAQGEPVAIHRTWLSSDYRQKAPVASPKKLTQSLDARGSAIRLFEVGSGDTLGICEGIETALAVRELSIKGHWVFGVLPVWACFSAANIRSFQVPPALEKSIKRLVVFSDNDASGTGINAAIALRDRLKETHPGLEVQIIAPEQQGQDWLDVLVALKQQSMQDH